MTDTPAFPPLRTEIAGHCVLELARQFGTPTYVYDAERIVRRVEDLRQFDVVRFAQKACSNLAVVDLSSFKCGFDAPALLEGTQDPAVKQVLIDNTHEAVSRGVFGAPSFFVGDDLFWGQDRFDHIAEALAR